MDFPVRLPFNSQHYSFIKMLNRDRCNLEFEGNRFISGRNSSSYYFHLTEQRVPIYPCFRGRVENFERSSPSEGEVLWAHDCNFIEIENDYGNILRIEHIEVNKQISKGMIVDLDTLLGHPRGYLGKPHIHVHFYRGLASSKPDFIVSPKDIEEIVSLGKESPVCITERDSHPHSRYNYFLNCRESR